MLKPLLALFLIALPVSAIAQNWQPQTRDVTYAISGTTGAELYQSIGDKGPLIGGKTRTIAHTNWALKWSRTYTPQESACVLTAAKPFLVITYTLPKPSAKLDSATTKKWSTFATGIKTHEEVHGQDIIAMVDEILTATVGLRVEDDKPCMKIRTEVLTLVKQANETYKAKSRAFDQKELSKGGAVHQLILGLVN